MFDSLISKDVMDYFAASPIGPELEVSHVFRETSHPISKALREIFARVPSESLASVLEDANFIALYGRQDDPETQWFAKEQIVITELRAMIGQLRMQCLLAQSTTDRPIPYDQEALADIPVSKDRLVPLSAFEIHEGVLIRKAHAYVITPPIPAANSSYWITRALLNTGLRDATWVRLDPLIHGPAGSFPIMSYRMLWYGPPLLWEHIETIKREGFGRWAPGPLSSAGEYTDFAWTPRADEIHLYLEEVPKCHDLAISGSRYFHVIFSRPTHQVIHLDGSVRIYTEQVLMSRRAQHVHRTGKIGTRVKVFRLDRPIPPEAVAALGGNYFVWNYDVAHFFDPAVPESFCGKQE